MRKSNQGISLIELMIGMAVGLVIVAAMISIYTKQAQSFRQLEAVSRLQENARYAFEIMGYDLRMAGNWGCHNPMQTTPVNFVTNSANNWWSHTGRPLFGVAETADANAMGDAGFPADYGGNALRGDTVIVLRTDHDTPPSTVQDYDHGTSSIPLSAMPAAAGDQAQTGDLLIFTDCQNQTAVFQMTGSTGDPAPVPAPNPLQVGWIDHKVINPPNPGNNQAHLSAAPLPGQVDNARVYKLLAHAYYLRNSPRRYANSAANIPSLYRQVLTRNANGATTAAEELVDGVIDMRVRYGEDTSADGAIDTYVAANAVTNWSNVLAIRVTLTLESTEDNVSTNNAAYTYFNGVNAAANLRLRKQFTATFGIRGRVN